MLRIIGFTGDIFLFLAGFVAGIIFSIYGTTVLVTVDSKVDELNPIFLFPPSYYIVGILGMVGLAVLLRTAARRVA